MKKIYMPLLRAAEIAFLDQTGDQSSLSFHWSIQMVQRTFIRWCKIFSKLPFWANNIVLIVLSAVAS